MDSQWLQSQFKLHPEKKKVDLAKQLGLEAPAISKILAGMRDIKAQEYIKMRRFFGLPTDGSRSLKRKNSIIQSYSSPQNKNALKEKQNGGWVIPKEHLPEKMGENLKNLRVFRIEDDGMAPDFKKGTFVVLDTSQTKPSPPGVFLISDGVAEIVRRCTTVAQSKPLKIKISAVNPDYETETLPFKEGILLGRIVAKLEWI